MARPATLPGGPMHRADSDYSLLDPASGASSFFAQSDEEGDIVRVRVKTASEHGGNAQHPFLPHPTYQPSLAGLPPGLPPVPRRSGCGRSPLGRPSSDPEEPFPLPSDHEASTLYGTQYGTERSASTDLGHTSDADADTRMADSILGSTTAHAARGTWQQTRDDGEGAGADPQGADANIEEGDPAGSQGGGPNPTLNGPQRLTPVRWASGGGAQPSGSAAAGGSAAPVAATAAMAAAAWGAASSPSPSSAPGMSPGPDGSASAMAASALGRVSGGGGSLGASAYARRRSSGGGAGSLGGSAHGRNSAPGGAGGGFGGAVAVGVFGLGDGDDLGEEDDEYGGGLMGVLAALPDSVLNSIPPALLQHLQQLEEERDELAGRLLDADAEIHQLRASYQQLSTQHASHQSWLNQLLAAQLEAVEARSRRRARLDAAELEREASRASEGGAAAEQEREREVGRTSAGGAAPVQEREAGADKLSAGGAAAGAAGTAAATGSSSSSFHAGVAVAEAGDGEVAGGEAGAARTAGSDRAASSVEKAGGGSTLSQGATGGGDGAGGVTAAAGAAESVGHGAEVAGGSEAAGVAELRAGLAAYSGGQVGDNAADMGQSPEAPGGRAVTDGPSSEPPVVLPARRVEKTEEVKPRGATAAACADVAEQPADDKGAAAAKKSTSTGSGEVHADCSAGDRDSAEVKETCVEAAAFPEAPEDARPEEGKQGMAAARNGGEGGKGAAAPAADAAPKQKMEKQKQEQQPALQQEQRQGAVTKKGDTGGGGSSMLPLLAVVLVVLVVLGGGGMVALKGKPPIPGPSSTLPAQAPTLHSATRADTPLTSGDTAHTAQVPGSGPAALIEPPGTAGQAEAAAQGGTAYPSDVAVSDGLHSGHGGAQEADTLAAAAVDLGPAEQEDAHALADEGHGAEAGQRACGTGGQEGGVCGWAGDALPTNVPEAQQQPQSEPAEQHADAPTDTLAPVQIKQDEEMREAEQPGQQQQQEQERNQGLEREQEHAEVWADAEEDAPWLSGADAAAASPDSEAQRPTADASAHGDGDGADEATVEGGDGAAGAHQHVRLPDRQPTQPQQAQAAWAAGQYWCWPPSATASSSSPTPEECGPAPQPAAAPALPQGSSWSLLTSGVVAAGMEAQPPSCEVLGELLHTLSGPVPAGSVDGAAGGVAATGPGAAGALRAAMGRTLELWHPLGTAGRLMDRLAGAKADAWEESAGPFRPAPGVGRVAAWAATHWLPALSPLVRSVTDDDELPESVAMAGRAVARPFRLLCAAGSSPPTAQGAAPPAASSSSSSRSPETAEAFAAMESSLRDLAAILQVHVDHSYGGGAASVAGALAAAEACVGWQSGRVEAEADAVECRARCSPRSRLKSALRRLGIPERSLEQDLPPPSPTSPSSSSTTSTTTSSAGEGPSLDLDPEAWLARGTHLRAWLEEALLTADAWLGEAGDAVRLAGEAARQEVAAVGAAWAPMLRVVFDSAVDGGEGGGEGEGQAGGGTGLDWGTIREKLRGAAGQAQQAQQEAWRLAGEVTREAWRAVAEVQGHQGEVLAAVWGRMRDGWAQAQQKLQQRLEHLQDHQGISQGASALMPAWALEQLVSAARQAYHAAGLDCECGAGGFTSDDAAPLLGGGGSGVNGTAGPACTAGLRALVQSLGVAEGAGGTEAEGRRAGAGEGARAREVQLLRGVATAVRRLEAELEALGVAVGEVRSRCEWVGAGLLVYGKRQREAAAAAGAAATPVA